MALIGGEAGSGKSRLVRELADGAAARRRAGALRRVRLGRAAALRAVRRCAVQLVRGIGSETLREAIGPGGGELSRLLPDLPERVGELRPPPGVDPDTERHRLHGAVSDLLVAASREAPLVLVIEDAHWADTPTLLLLRHLARGASEAPGLLVTTFRDTEAEVPEALASALVDLRRSEGVSRMRLGR